jgi:hypothetical protein
LAGGGVRGRELGRTLGVGLGWAMAVSVTKSGAFVAKTPTIARGNWRIDFRNIDLGEAAW